LPHKKQEDSGFHGDKFVLWLRYCFYVVSHSNLGGFNIILPHCYPIALHLTVWL